MWLTVKARIFWAGRGRKSQTCHVMKAVVSAAREIKMRDKPPSLFSSKTMTHVCVCGGVVGGAGWWS